MVEGKVPANHRHGGVGTDRDYDREPPSTTSGRSNTTSGRPNRDNNRKLDSDNHNKKMAAAASSKIDYDHHKSAKSKNDRVYHDHGSNHDGDYHDHGVANGSKHDHSSQEDYDSCDCAGISRSKTRQSAKPSKDERQSVKPSKDERPSRNSR